MLKSYAPRERKQSSKEEEEYVEIKLLMDSTCLVWSISLGFHLRFTMPHALSCYQSFPQWHAEGFGPQVSLLSPLLAEREVMWQSLL